MAHNILSSGDDGRPWTAVPGLLSPKFKHKINVVDDTQTDLVGQVLPIDAASRSLCRCPRVKIECGDFSPHLRVDVGKKRHARRVANNARIDIAATVSPERRGDHERYIRILIRMPPIFARRGPIHAPAGRTTARR